ncbi:hypothetical protein ACC735_39825, partial [Rhizobium ruizarguesonis]
FCDRIIHLGFSHACRAGISFGKDDMVIPHAKAKIVADTENLVKEYEQQYNDDLAFEGVMQLAEIGEGHAFARLVMVE